MSLRTMLRPPTLLEWVIIVLVIMVGLAVLFPNFPIDFDRPPARPAPDGAAGGPEARQSVAVGVSPRDAFPYSRA
jgi:hypothetical protein